MDNRRRPEDRDMVRAARKNLLSVLESSSGDPGKVREEVLLVAADLSAEESGVLDDPGLMDLEDLADASEAPRHGRFPEMGNNS